MLEPFLVIDNLLPAETADHIENVLMSEINWKFISDITFNTLYQNTPPPPTQITLILVQPAGLVQVPELVKFTTLTNLPLSSVSENLDICSVPSGYTIPFSPIFVAIFNPFYL
jgi:hypothetical protein